MSIEEISGTRYLDLSAAQQHSLIETASDLAAAIRTLLATGALVNKDGKIIPNRFKIKQEDNNHARLHASPPSFIRRRDRLGIPARFRRTGPGAKRPATGD